MSLVMKGSKGRVTNEDKAIISIMSLGRRRGRSHIAPENGGGGCMFPDQRVQREDWRDTAWASLPAELLRNIIQRVEEAGQTWPGRRDVVACAAVCKSWRETVKDVVKTPEQCGSITFTISLKQPGPRDAPIQCFIRRDRATSTYRLYLGLSPALSDGMSKLLLAAKKIRRATRTEFRVFLSGKEFSTGSSSYVGKLISNFLGTKFTVYDNHQNHALPQEVCCGCQSMDSSNSSYPEKNHHRLVTVSYELNVFRTRGPRRMQCIMHSLPFQREDGNGSGESSSKGEPLMLKNKTPRWHEQLQCWCLNFKGRVTVASVKNFQLVASAENLERLPAENLERLPAEEQERDVLQFGKIGKDIFTMDYRFPMSAFEAFAICLSSFDTKPACE